MNATRTGWAALLVFATLTIPAMKSRAWDQDQHRWMVSDAAHYMSNSGDEFLSFIAGWLDWSTGSNNLIQDPKHFWREHDDCSPEHIGS